MVICMASIANMGHAQNVGIGTTNPNASAMLQVSSTTRGFLPPRMTSSQRTNIVSPLNGLIVYDTDMERPFIYMDGIWRYFLSNDVWAHNGDAIYSSSTKNVGIGTASPSERLHVAGNFRLVGNMETTGEINFLAATGIINFKNGGEDKAFVQLSGENLRVGTFSSNLTGGFIVRTGGGDRLTVTNDGNVGFGTSSPEARIDVVGNVRLTGKMLRSDNGAANMLAIAWGGITGPGGISSGSGNFTVTHIGVGIYEITCPTSDGSSIIICQTSGVNFSLGATNFGSQKFMVYIRSTTTAQLTDAFFQFVIHSF
jgi:hypothetical protein